MRCSKSSCPTGTLKNYALLASAIPPLVVGLAAVDVSPTNDPLFKYPICSRAMPGVF